jgi:protein disulfide-isomerase-like protein
VHSSRFFQSFKLPHTTSHLFLLRRNYYYYWLVINPSNLLLLARQKIRSWHFFIEATMVLLGCFSVVVQMSLLLITALGATATTDVLLDHVNFADKTKSKTVFLKAYAPWCGHCQELAPEWERMALHWENNPKVLVASIDCTAEEKLCLSLGVAAFPTILYGDASSEGAFLQVYQGDKEYEALSKFADETLIKPFCSPGDTAFCGPSERNKIHQLWKLSAEQLQAAIDRKRSLITVEEHNFQKVFQAMQSEHDKHSHEYEFHLARLKANLKLLQAVARGKK